MKFKKVDLIFLIIFLILTIISIDLMLVEAHRNLITNIWDVQAYKDQAILLTPEEILSRFLIVFIVCLVGNILPVPTPYSWAVCLGFAYYPINPLFPLLFGLVAALGCLFGELGGYFVGRGAAELISEERAQNLNKYQEYLLDHPKLAPFLIFLFGFTPLNDDMLTVPLGLIKYDAKKTIIFIWLGKLCMMLLFAYNVLNLCNLIGGDNWIMSIATLYIIVIMIYLMVKPEIIKSLLEILGLNRVLKEKEN